MNHRNVLLSTGMAFLLIGALAGYLYGSSTAATTKTVLVTSMMEGSTFQYAYDEVASAYANHQLLLDARNISVLVNQFESKRQLIGKDMRMDCNRANKIGTSWEITPDPKKSRLY